MIQLLNHKFKRTTFLTVGCFAFLGGLFLGKYETWSTGLLVFSLVMSIVSLPRKRFSALLAVILCSFVIGTLRGGQFAQKLYPYEELYGKRVVLEAEATTDAVYSNNGQLAFDADRVKILEPFEQAVPGSIKVGGRGEPSVARGDVLRLTGNLYPTGGSKQGRMSFAQLEVIVPDDNWINQLRRNFAAGMFTAIPEPEASFGLGLLIGQRTTLPDYLEDQLSIAGLTHIIAVSGYNLTIIVRMVRRALGRRSKYQSTAVAFGLIVLFVLVTGFSASIVRAAVVSTLSLLAWYYGRSIKPLLVLGVSAALTAAWNPIYIWSDIGWYLSFLAFFGVLIIAPLVKQRLWGEKDQKLLGQVVLESICAQLMAAPIILYIFGEVSLIALVSNAVIVPLVPFAMLFSFIAGIAGMLVPTLSGLIAWPATLLLTYMLDLVAVFSKIPGALLTTKISFGYMLYIYGAILCVTILLQLAVKRKYGKITETNIIE